MSVSCHASVASSFLSLLCTFNNISGGVVLCVWFVRVCYKEKGADHLYRGFKTVKTVPTVPPGLYKAHAGQTLASLQQADVIGRILVQK